MPTAYTRDPVTGELTIMINKEGDTVAKPETRDPGIPIGDTQQDPFWQMIADQGGKAAAYGRLMGKGPVPPGFGQDGRTGSGPFSFSRTGKDNALLYGMLALAAVATVVIMSRKQAAPAVARPRKVKK